jgi:xylan 1,4-beta-xylosidase
MNNYIENPILPGFHPDPSIIRVGEDFYLAVSTFEWFPGVSIYHSRDLQNWELAARPLNRISQLDMKGNDASGGVFAPCLSYDNGIFYLVYTNVRTHWYEFMDCHNYLVTATDIRGQWSEPVYLHSLGFDPSLFHDEDGRKWLVSIVRNYRNNRTQKIALQEYDPVNRKMIGQWKEIYGGSGITAPEGPHLYRKNGYYYIITAEGGTEYGHAVTMARSRSIDGPYELHPSNPILTSRNNMALPLQKAGHADIVEAADGEWYMVHLCGRPLSPFRRCILGRETAIQHVVWKEDQWLYLADGGNEPLIKVPVSWPVNKKVEREIRYDFDSPELNPDFLSLRVPIGENASLTEKPGYLCLTGRDSPNSRFDQTVLARRQEDFSFSFETEMEFEPASERQMAGIMYYYDEWDFYYLRVTCNLKGEKILDILRMNRGKTSYEPIDGILLPMDKTICLKLEVNGVNGQFYYRTDENWKAAGGSLDASLLSDEYPEEGAYTGAMVGLGCHDMAYRSAKAYFRYAIYKRG